MALLWGEAQLCGVGGWIATKISVSSKQKLV